MMKRKKIYKILICVACAFALVGVISVLAVEPDQLVARDWLIFGAGSINTAFRVYNPSTGNYSLKEEGTVSYPPDMLISGSNEFSISANMSDLRMNSVYGEIDNKIWSREVTWSFLPIDPYGSSFPPLIDTGDKVRFSFGLDYVHQNRSNIGFDKVTVKVRYKLLDDPTIYEQTLLDNAPFYSEPSDLLNDNIYTVRFDSPGRGSIWYFDITLSRSTGGLALLPVQTGQTYFRLGFSFCSINHYRATGESGQANTNIDSYAFYQDELDRRADSFFSGLGFSSSEGFVNSVLDPSTFNRDSNFVAAFSIWGNIFTACFNAFRLDLVFYVFLGIGAAFLFFGVIPSVIRNVRHHFTRSHRKGHD